MAADPVWLELKSEEVRSDLEALQRRTKEDKLTEAIWKITNGSENPESETAKGWVEGQFTKEEVSRRVNSDKRTAAHRLGVEQNDKFVR